MPSLHATIRSAGLFALAALAVATPAAHADPLWSTAEPLAQIEQGFTTYAAASRPVYPQGPDMSLTGVAPGMTEHGAWISSDVDEHHGGSRFRRVTYWTSSNREFVVETNHAGKLLSASEAGPEGFVTYLTVLDYGGNAKGDPGAHVGSVLVPQVVSTLGGAHQNGLDGSLPPYPGYGAPFNKDMIAAGAYVASSPRKRMTIAGFTGTVYTLQFGSTPREIDVLQDGTLQPLLQVDKIHTRSGRLINHQNRLRSRVTTPSAAASLQLTHKTFIHYVHKWRGLVKAARAAAMRAQHKGRH